MAVTIAYGLIILGFINLIWFGFWFLISWSGEIGTKFSKVVGTDNANTDKYAAMAAGYKKRALQRTVISAVVIGAGYLVKFFFEP